MVKFEEYLSLNARDINRDITKMRRVGTMLLIAIVFSKLVTLVTLINPEY